MQNSCSIPTINANFEVIKKLLTESKNIAIVGISNEPGKDSYEVAAYLQKNGYKIIPVNPKYPEILGEKSYASLSQVPCSIDIVDVFRRVEAIPEIAQAVLALPNKPKGFWMQLGISHDPSAEILQKVGIVVVQSQCIKIVHSKI